ncbi:hypothetical protein AMTRI_Chr11g99710 [Amborella trichopoda]
MVVDERKHVVMMPFMAQGHLIPFAAIAELLSERSPPKITLAAGAVDVAELPFSSADHGLPLDAENTDALPYHLIIRLFEACETLEPAFESFYGWTGLVAERLGIHHVVFNTGGAFGTLGFKSTWFHLPHVGTDADEFPVSGMPGATLHRTQLVSQLRAADGKDRWSIFLQRQISLSMHPKRDGMLCNTVAEIEPDGLRLLERGGKPLGISAESCIAWLDTQPLHSVLFGWNLKELVMGLESSGARFILVVRLPLEFPITAEFRSEWLPEGFEEGVKDRGLIITGWAPQLMILSHKATCALLSHCGWNSVLESLSQGVPLIGWPMGAEQFLNSTMLGDEKVGVCVEVWREKVARVVAAVVKGEKGEALRKGMAEEESGGGSSLRAMDEFVASIVSPHVLKKSKS